jgi:signal transduction histidine kinase/CheY-like chemotaxis protein/HAMP domain-containing protein
MKFRSLFPPLALRWLLLVPFLIQILGVVGVVGYLSYYSGKKAVEELAHQLLEETSDRVIQTTNHYLDKAYEINQAHQPLVKSRLTSFDNLDQIHRYLIQAHQDFPEINQVMFGNPEGDFLTSQRSMNEELTAVEPTDGQFQAGRSQKNNPKRLDLYAVKEGGRLGQHLQTIEQVDVRDRAWYRRAVTTGESGWCEPLLIGNGNVVTINAYTPFYSASSGDLKGVFAVSLSLEKLNQLLAQQTVGHTGQVVILHRNGSLIASSKKNTASATTIPFRSVLERLQTIDQQWFPGWENAHPLLEVSTEELEANFGPLAEIMSSQESLLQVNGEDQYLHIMPYQNQYGLDWMIVTVIPQSRLMKAIEINRKHTLVIGGLTIFTVTSLTLAMTYQLTKALQRLSHASRSIAEGNWQHPIPEDSQIKEFNALAHAYNRMGREIQQNYDYLCRALAELKATNQRLQQFLEAIPVGIGIIDAQGNPCYTNQRAVDLLGKGIVKLKNLADIPEVYQIYLAGTKQLYPYEKLALVRALNGEFASNNDVEIHLPDQHNRIIPLETRGTPIYNQAGEIEYALVTFQDITERKQSERQLRELSERLELSLAAGQIGCWQWDIAQKCAFWDQRMCEIFAVTYPISSAEIQAIYNSRLHPDDRDRVDQLFHNAISQQTAFDTEFRIIHPDGSVHFIKTYGLIHFDSQGKAQSMIGVNFEITDLKNTQIELEQKNTELVQANRLKDEFLATINHELRTPLNAILGMTQALEQEALGAINPRQHKTIQVIQRSGSHLLEMVNNLLELSKLESGKQELHYTPTSVIELCQCATTIVQPEAQNKQLQVETKFPSPLLKICIEERLLRQVLINLLNNAIKFTPRGGKITLEVLFPIPRGENWISFAVYDTGIGIAAENLQKIFEPFIQIDSALNRKYQGTGIGLSLVKQIVALHGGEVRVTSEEGIGSCFVLELPCVMATDGSEFKLKSWQEGEKAPVILVIDDNEGNLMTLSNYLEARGYRLLAGHNQAKAVELARSHDPDLVILTWEGSDQQGLEMIHTIRRDGELVSTPIIAIAPQTLSDERDWETEVAHAFRKPVKLQELARTIQRILNHR